MRRLRSVVDVATGGLGDNEPFMRLFVGRLVTNAGDSLYLIAAMWLVFELTGSSFYTGLAAFLGGVPSVLAFLTGPLVDAWSLRRILVWTQVVNGLIVLSVPVAAWLGYLSVWHVLLLMPLLTFINQFVYPAQSAAIPRIVEDEDLATANSLLSAAFRGADAVFSAASGVLVALVGAVTLYVVDAATFWTAVVLFVGLHIPGEESPDDAGGATDGRGEPANPGTDGSAGGDEDGSDPVADYVADLRDGIQYLRGSLVVVVLLGVVITNASFGALRGVLPAFASGRGGAELFGLLMAARAGGTLAGTAGASLVDDRPFGTFVVVSMFVSGACLIGAFAAPWTPVTVGLLFAGYVPVGAFNVLFWAVLQSAVEGDLLGRVTSVVQSVAVVMLPVGALLGGAAASVVGATNVLYAVGAGGVFIALYFATRRQLLTLPPVPEIDAATLGLERGAAGAASSAESGVVDAADS